MQVRFLVGVFGGLWWSLVAVEMVLLSVLSMNSESFLPLYGHELAH